MKNNDKIKVMKISTLVLYLSSFFMTLYRNTILGESYRFYVQSVGAGGFFSFVLFFLIAYNIYLFVTKKDYAKEVYVVITMIGIIMFIGLAASFPAGSTAGASLVFQVVFLGFMILLAANDNASIDIYNYIRKIYYEVFQPSKKPTPQKRKTREERYEEEHAELHDMDFEKLKKKQDDEEFYARRALQPKRTLDEIDESRYKNRQTESILYEPKVEEPVIKPVIEVQPIIEPEELETGFTVKAPQMEAPKMVNPYLQKPDYTK